MILNFKVFHISPSMNSLCISERYLNAATELGGLVGQDEIPVDSKDGCVLTSMWVHKPLTS